MARFAGRAALVSRTPHVRGGVPKLFESVRGSWLPGVREREREREGRERKEMQTYITCRCLSQFIWVFTFSGWSLLV